MLKNKILTALALTMTLGVGFSAQADFSDIAEEQAQLFLAEDCDSIVELSEIQATETASTFTEDKHQIFYEFSMTYEVVWGSETLGEYYVWGQGEEARDELVTTETSFTCPVASESISQ